MEAANGFGSMAFVPFIVTVMFMAQMAQNPVGLEPIIFLSSQECVLERVPLTDFL